MIDNHNIKNLLIDEVKTRFDLKERTMSFGVSYLDDALIGIAPNDLILIGARSGAGKTQLCVNIAKNAISNGKRCHFFALEAEPGEVTRRVKFEIFQNLYRERYNGASCDYQKWSFGHYLPQLSALEADANEIFLEKYSKGFYVHYKEGEFTVHSMIKEVVKASKKTDLIIIDHVHYFDFDDDNENRAIKKIAKTARDLVLENGVPIILVSHIRKSNPKYETYAPSLEDFHGSSDLYKIATRAITLGPGHVDTKSGVAETFISIVKNRYDSSVTRYTGKVQYNYLKGIYNEGYEVGSNYQKREKEFETLNGYDRPRFAKGIRS